LPLITPGVRQVAPAFRHPSPTSIFFSVILA
jgi:hypothetical protein